MGAWSEFPTAATTTTPLETAYETAAASRGEYVSLLGSPGSRRPPRLRLITRAPWSTAQWIAADSASSEIVPSVSTTFAISSWAGKAIPAMPTPLFIAAAISPATKVPCPCSSVSALPPTKLFESRIRPANSGWPPSIPESTTATRTGARIGRLEPGVERPVLVEVPLLGCERVVRDERGRGGRRRERRDGERRDQDASHGTLSGSVTPTAKPWPGATRAR